MKKLNLGDRVKILTKNEKGRIAFIGKTNFSDGTWVGVNLDNAVGKNNGTVGDTCYFKCPMNNGIFVRASQIEKESVENDQDLPHGTVSDEITRIKYRIADAKCNEECCLCEPKRLDILTAKPRIKCYQKDPNPQSLKDPTFKSQLQVIKKEDDLREPKRLGNVKAKTRIKAQNDPNPQRQDDPIFKTQLQVIMEEGCLCKRKRLGSLKTKRRVKCQMDPNPQSQEDPIFKPQLQVIKKDYLCQPKRLGILTTKPRINCQNDTNSQISDHPIFKVNKDDGSLCEAKRLGSLKTKLCLKCCKNDPSPPSLENPIFKSEQQNLKKENCLCDSTQLGTLKAKHRMKCQFDPNPQSLDDPIFKSQLQVLRKENRHLRNKMQSTEKALLEVRGKYNAAMEENQLLKNEIRYKNKLIKIQKLHLRLLKMQCDSLHADSAYTARERVNQREEDKPSGEHPDILNDVSNDSDGEFSLEAIKAMTAMKRILHLEEENRIMFEGLVGLRNWFISEFQSQFQNIKSSRKRNRSHLKKTKNTSSSIPGSLDSSAIMKAGNCSVVEPTSQQRECVKILCETKKFNEITIRSWGFRKQDETTNSSFKVPKCDNSTQKELVLFNKNFELGKHISNQLTSGRNSKSFLTISEICKDSLTILPGWENGSPNDCQTSKLVPMSTKQEELSKPGLMDKILNAVFSKRDVGFCQPAASLIQQQYMVKGNSDHNSISEKFEVQPESSKALSVDAKEIADKPSDRCAKVLPK